MAYVVLRGEKRVADVVTRVYGDLKAADAKRAHAALVRANPQLAEQSALGPGAIVVVPIIPGLPAAPPDRAETPAGEVVAEMSSSLDAYRKKLGTADRVEQAAATALVSLLKSKEMKALVRELPDAGSYVERAAAAARARVAEHDRRSAFLKALTKAQADLDELARKLG